MQKPIEVTLYELMAARNNQTWSPVGDPVYFAGQMIYIKQLICPSQIILIQLWLNDNIYYFKVLSGQDVWGSTALMVDLHGKGFSEVEYDRYSIQTAYFKLIKLALLSISIWTI